ncbi:16S rRNA (cytidine(1402)-2'-O)-methyltransferase [Cobetia marina]|uniref:16S rRNA (cytidine(1402)-2'-O)-methyltransferase n=1 Tax=Cobetia marina TaxID=28258 RepID=UPI0038511BFF
MSESSEGVLYVVATPIGNLDDLSPRAARVLGEVDLIAAEDTRHSARLLRHLGLEVPMMSLHDHNERGRVDQLCQALEAGRRVALVSDAGTPLISDPGFIVVRALRERGFKVVPLPGPCALITALSAAGLPTDRFTFEGFLAHKGGPRQARLTALREDGATHVLYESPHRIQALLKDIHDVLGARRVVLARELTKTFETFLDGTAAELLAMMEADGDQTRGEFVVMIEGAPAREGDEAASVEGDALLKVLWEEGVGVKQMAAIATSLVGGRKKAWYAKAQALKDAAEPREA